MIADNEEENGQDTGPPTLKQRVRRVADNHWAEAFILFLVLLDVIFVAVEAGIDHQLLCINGKVVSAGSEHAGSEHMVEHNPHALVQASHYQVPESFLSTSSVGKHSHGVRLRTGTAGASSGGFSLAAGIVSIAEHEILTCDTREGHHAEHIMHTCHMWSIIILIIFTVELIAKWWAIPDFMANPYHKLDFFVVTVSLLVDAVILPVIEEHMSQEAVTEQEKEKEHREVATINLVLGLLMFSRCWRLVRIVHGLYEQYEGIREAAEEQALEGAAGENAKLRQALKDQGLNPDEEIQKRS